MTAPLRIVFLDFDGVLNSTAWYVHRHESGQSLALAHGKEEEIDPAAVALLNQLLDRSGALVVISSTWRMLGLMECKDVLHARGFTGKVVDVTPRSSHGVRGREIQAWLDAYHRPVERFVILDDESDMEHLMPRLVQTSQPVGLTQADVNRAVAMLEADEPRAARVA